MQTMSDVLFLDFLVAQHLRREKFEHVGPLADDVVLPDYDPGGSIDAGDQKHEHQQKDTAQ